RLEAGAHGLKELRAPARTAQQQLHETLSALDAMLPTSKLDPSYRRAYRAAARAYGAVSGRDPRTGARVRPGYHGLAAELAKASARVRRGAGAVRGAMARLRRLLGGLDQLARGARRLRHGIATLEDGLDGLANGGARLRGGATSLVAGIRRLQDGGGALAAGLSSLAAGSSELASGLGRAHAKGGALAYGIGRIRSGTQRVAGRMGGLRGQFSQLDRLPSLFGSGYAVLAALDTAHPTQRNAASFAVNLDRGGDAAEFVVVKNGAPTRAHDDLRAQLEHDAATLSRETGARVAVGGP